MPRLHNQCLHLLKLLRSAAIPSRFRVNFEGSESGGGTFEMRKTIPVLVLVSALPLLLYGFSSGPPTRRTGADVETFRYPAE